MRQYISESFEPPSPIDTKKSQLLVYVSENIHQAIRMDSTGEPYTIYEYSVTEYTKLEWLQLQAERLESQINSVMERQSAAEDALLALMDGGIV